MDFIDNVNQLLAMSDDVPFMGPAASNRQIIAFEKILGITFPETYKLFLREFGVLDFNGLEFYGITLNGINADSIPCVLFATKDAQKKGEISNEMILVQESGDGYVYCIDWSIVNKNGEPAVVEVPLSYRDTGEKSVVSDNFGEFLITRIQENI